jgi:hypothetical protein
MSALFIIVKWRRKFSSGPSDYEYHLLDKCHDGSMSDKEMVADWLIGKHDEYDWSEHYRGIDFHICKKLPAEVKEAMVKTLHWQSRHYHDRALEVHKLEVLK